MITSFAYKVVDEQTGQLTGKATVYTYIPPLHIIYAYTAILYAYVLYANVLYICI